MKVMIYEDYAGILTKNGKFVKMLTPGKYHFSKVLGYACEEVHVKGVFQEEDMISYEVLSQDPWIKANTVQFHVPDGYVGLIYQNGNLYGATKQSRTIFWCVHDEYEMKLLSTEQIRIGGDIAKAMLDVMPQDFFTTVEVPAGGVALLYFDNVYQETLPAGVYHFWNDRVAVTYQLVNMKQTVINVNGQETLTKDKVGIRANMTCTYRITDALAMSENVENLFDQLYYKVQLVLREVAGNYKLDEILEMREAISEEVFMRLKACEDVFHIELVNVGIRDIILPGDIKTIMNSVLIAEKNAQANVIARREEVASTRSLLNTAKLMDENKTLYRLKELEYLERICDKVGEISVGGNAGLVEQLGVLLGAR